MAKVTCENCQAVKEWSYKENIVAFCPKAQKYVKKDDSCRKGKERK